MHQLNWLVNHRLESMHRREYDWIMVFDSQVTITPSCLWRVLEDGRIRLTSEDDGHKFGLPAPMDAVHEINIWLGGIAIQKVELTEGTLDLRLYFENGYVFEMLPNSSGYEAWDIINSVDRYIAVGGGTLSEFRNYQNGAG